MSGNELRLSEIEEMSFNPGKFINPWGFQVLIIDQKIRAEKREATGFYTALERRNTVGKESRGLGSFAAGD